MLCLGAALAVPYILTTKFEKKATGGIQFKFNLLFYILLFGFPYVRYLIRDHIFHKYPILTESYRPDIELMLVVSLFMRRPLIYHLSNRFLIGLNTDQLEKNWAIPSFRFGFRLITLVWGLALLLEALARIVLVYQLSTEMFLVVSKFMLYGTIGCTALWTIAYRRNVVKKYHEKHV